MEYGAWVKIVDFSTRNETAYSFPHEGKEKKEGAKGGEKGRKLNRNDISHKLKAIKF